MGLWLLIHARVPCFIVHDYIPGTDFPRSRRSTDVFDNRNVASPASPFFVSGTLFEQDSRYDLRALKGRSPTTLDFHDTFSAEENPPFRKDRVLSSSWAQYWDRRAGQYRGPAAGLLTSSRPSPTRTNGLSMVRRPGPTISSGWPSASAGGASSSSASTARRPDLSSGLSMSASGLPVVERPLPAARPLEIVPDRAAWVRPPDIIGVGKGSWTNFYEDSDMDDTPYLIEGSKVIVSRYYITLVEANFLCKL